MKTTAVALGLAASAFAAPAPSSESHNQECCFGISAYGVKGTVSEGFFGTVKQLPDGQLRIGQQNLQYESKFCTNSWNYGLYDQNRFGCILAGREEQFQCDSGKASWTGWNIGFEGIITLDGSAQWWACPTGDHSGQNIYKAPLPGSDYCTEVTLVANKCRAAHQSGGCSGPTCHRPVPHRLSPPVSLPRQNLTSVGTPRCASPPCTASRPKPTCDSPPCTPTCASPPCTPLRSGPTCASPPCTPLRPNPSRPMRPTCSDSDSECLNRSSRCPGELSGSWEFPHLIVPVESSKPDFAPGTSLFGTVSGSVTSYFNFDIPGDYEGKTCTARFMFPEQSQLETSSFELRGLGHVYGGWCREVSKSTTYSTAPQCENRNAFTFRPGNSYVLGKAQCQPGVMGFYIEGAANTYLKWFQDFNPCPIGLYLTAE